jgi:secreted PhoX family phosphatase
MNVGDRPLTWSPEAMEARMDLTRRDVMSYGAAVSLGVVVSGAVDALFAANPAAGARGPAAGYGPLVPDPDGMLDLPRGFRYRVLSREGDPLASGGTVPSRFDGMAAFAGRRGTTHLVRNHECRVGVPHPVQAPPSHTYDPEGPGGTTTLIVDRSGRTTEEYVSLAGTFVNCAGGPTPWGTWLTCEETEDSPGDSTMSHGWIFEVDPVDQSRNADPTPLTAMGRFQHEAVAVDPRTGVVYETEDAFQYPFGLFYRFLPERPLGGHGSLRAGGVLEAMRVPGVPDLSLVQEPGTTFTNIEWVAVPDPLATSTPTRLQDYGPAGITHAQKLEGAYWGNGSAYFVSSYARDAEGSGANHDGQVWRYDPRRNTLELVVVFGYDPAEQVGEGPDNIALSPYGGLMVCEDLGGENYVIGTTADGKTFPLARNRVNAGSEDDPEYGELAGVTFSADGRTLYFNVYNPGVTFAVTGPWARQR